jgi:hypothetical protein
MGSRLVSGGCRRVPGSRNILYERAGVTRGVTSSTMAILSARKLNYILFVAT